MVAGQADTGQAGRKVDFYKEIHDQKVQCFVCPLHCQLEDGETCYCRTRTNHAGKLYADAYNNPCIITSDPIEKLPLNNFKGMIPAGKFIFNK